MVLGMMAPLKSIPLQGTATQINPMANQQSSSSVILRKEINTTHRTRGTFLSAFKPSFLVGGEKGGLGNKYQSSGFSTTTTTTTTATNYYHYYYYYYYYYTSSPF